MPYDLPNGQLPFPLSFLASEGGVVATPFVIGDKSLITSGENWYVLCMTPDDFTDLVSVVAVGAPIALPDTYNKIWQQINQLAQFPNQIPEDSCMDLCQLILDCLDDTPALQQAIASYSLVSPIAQTAPEIQANLDAELVNEPVGCDQDIMFGMVTGYTDLMNTISEDILEIFAAASSPAGRIGDIIEAIPVIGEAPLDDLFQFVESFITDLNDAYAGAYTSQVRDDIRCDLFCLTVDTCNLTLEQARDYFYDELGQVISLTTWDGFLDDIIALSYSGLPAVWALHLLITQTIIFGGELVGFDTSRLLATIQSLYNDPDSDWTTVCTVCLWACILDFEVKEHGFTPFVGYLGANYSVWVTTEGFNSVDVQSDATHYRRTSTIDITLADAVHVDDIEMLYDYVKGSFTSGSLTAIALTTKIGGSGGTPVSSKTITADASSDGDNQTITDTVNGTIDYIQLFLRASFQTSASYSGTAQIKKLTIDGTGIKPPEFDC